MKLVRTTVEVITVLYISLMVYTAVSKLQDYNLSREQMAMMPLLKHIAHIAAWLLPVLEIVIAVLIFIPATRIVGLKVVTTLMTIFTAYIIYMMVNYENLPCSCGGILEALSWNGHLIFNGLFIILGLAAIILISKNPQVVQQKHIAVTNHIIP